MGKWNKDTRVIFMPNKNGRFLSNLGTILMNTK